MNLTTVVDLAQWSYVFPNILSLETFKRKYTFGIFTACVVTGNLIRERLRHIPLKYGNIYVEVIPSFFSFFKLTTMKPNHDWITATTMDRFVVPHFCKFDKYIHIDVDTLIMSEDIFNLFEEETSEKGIAAIPSETLLIEHVIAFSGAEFLLDLVKENRNTFNAGVMLLDAKKLKQHKLDKFATDIYERGDNTVYINDELILNLYDPDFKTLDNKYNIKIYFYEDYKIQPDQITIAHFSGKQYKPWERTHFSNIAKIRKCYGLWEYYYYCSLESFSPSVIKK